jgi:hypothetical protein
MPKKRKLNSKNPKYQQASKDTTPQIKKRVLMCEANPVNTRTGKKDYNVKIPVYGVWYE